MKCWKYWLILLLVYNFYCIALCCCLLNSVLCARVSALWLTVQLLFFLTLHASYEIMHQFILAKSYWGRNVLLMQISGSRTRKTCASYSETSEIFAFSLREISSVTSERFKNKGCFRQCGDIPGSYLFSYTLLSGVITYSCQLKWTSSSPLLAKSDNCGCHLPSRDSASTRLMSAGNASDLLKLLSAASSLNRCLG